MEGGRSDGGEVDNISRNEAAGYKAERDAQRADVNKTNQFGSKEEVINEERKKMKEEQRSFALVPHGK